MDYIAYILLGSMLVFIFLYWLEISLLLMMVPKIQTNNMGIKNLKYQEFNSAWNRFVTKKL